MLRRLPILPTLIVLAAVAVMIRLGFWQIDRLHEKEAMIARYVQAQSSEKSLGNLSFVNPLADVSFRKVAVDCSAVENWNAIAGQNSSGQPGYAHIANCSYERAVHIHGSITRQVDVAIGWSKTPANPEWRGGHVEGMIIVNKNRWRIIANPPLAGLSANAVPDPSDLPNNHLAYAVQWFLFALTALVIYFLALRKRLAASG